MGAVARARAAARTFAANAFKAATTLSSRSHSRSSMKSNHEKDADRAPPSTPQPNGIKSPYEGARSEDGKMEGFGVMKFANGSVYEGQWKEDQRMGRGKMKYPDGKVYEGEFFAGKPEGRGVFKYPSGDVYEGDFVQGRWDGVGTFTTKKGEEYTGQWKEGKLEGQGTFHYGDGNTYSGEFKAGSMWGRGTYKYNDGSVYEGEWKEGEKHGRGIFRGADGSIYEGEWTNGTKAGEPSLSEKMRANEEAMRKINVTEEAKKTRQTKDELLPPNPTPPQTAAGASKPRPQSGGRAQPYGKTPLAWSSPNGHGGVQQPPPDPWARRR